MTDSQPSVVSRTHYVYARAHVYKETCVRLLSKQSYRISVPGDYSLHLHRVAQLLRYIICWRLERWRPLRAPLRVRGCAHCETQNFRTWGSMQFRCVQPPTSISTRTIAEIDLPS